MYGLPTESSNDCIGVFHSSEMDDPTQYDEGYYVAAFIEPVIGCILGPYATEDRAVQAMNDGAWMGEQSSRLERVNGAYRAKREA